MGDAGGVVGGGVGGKKLVVLGVEGVELAGELFEGGLGFVYAEVAGLLEGGD